VQGKRFVPALAAHFTSSRDLPEASDVGSLIHPALVSATSTGSTRGWSRGVLIAEGRKRRQRATEKVASVASAAGRPAEGSKRAVGVLPLRRSGANERP